MHSGDEALVTFRKDGIFSKVTFMGIQFHSAPLGAWIDLFAKANECEVFEYAVTPNVDGMVTFHESPAFASNYVGAAYRICDSRILELLARLKNIYLPALPGSDIVAALFQSEKIMKRRIAVLGPSFAEFCLLQEKYSKFFLVWIDAPNPLTPDTSMWITCLDAVEEAKFDILLVCMTSPKQERLCSDLRARGSCKGLAICAGASLDFLTGRQTRAPLAFQKLRLEWLHRLLSNPKRLWRRYLVKGPRILLIWALR